MRTAGSERQVLLDVPWTEQFQFIDRNVGVVEIDPHRAGVGRWEMQLFESAPILLPHASVVRQYATVLGHLSEHLVCS